MQSTSSLVSTSTLLPIIEACSQADSNTLVIFDIDEVLISVVDAAFQTDERRALLYKKLREYDTAANVMWSATIWPQCSLRLVDPLLLNLLAYLKNKAIKTLALTAGWAGEFGEHSAFEEIRTERLAQLQLNFDWSFDISQKIVFNHTAEYNRRPVFHKGIIFACRLPKSLVLNSFLKHMNYRPHSIIFVDDSLHNIYDLQKFCRSQSIDFQGFHYTGAQHLIKEVCHARTALQIKHLQHHKQWLVDDQADKLLN